MGSADQMLKVELGTDEVSDEDFINYSRKHRQIAQAVLKTIFRRRRLLPTEHDKPECFARESEPHLSAIASVIAENEPINLILPGFPAKSPNRMKTLSALPDLAEKHALHNLNSLCEEIGAVYPPGAYITICSDGRVFADLVHIPDQDVSDYGNYLQEYANRVHPEKFSFFNLDQVYPEVRDYTTLREELLIQYGESIYQLRRRCRTEEEAKAMYLGITRFIVEDYSGLDMFKSESRTTLQKLAKSVAYRVIQRSNAWTRLLEQHFAGAVRLSIHPQFRVSKKIGITLAESDDCWLTPWHGVALRKGDKILLVKRGEAEQTGLLAFENGRPSHFEFIPGNKV